MTEIIEVKNNRDLRDFIRFPRKLYKNCPYYVPALDKGEEKLLTKHPALAFCDLRMWLAVRDGKIVGRIAGIINHRCNEIKGQKRIRFAWFDVIEDPEVARMLFQTVEDWGRSQGLEEICGPSRYSNMEKQAMLVEGFDHITSIGADFNYPYYPEYMDAMGFEKEVDYIQYKVKVTPVSERISRLADLLAKKYHVRLREIKDKEQLRRDGYAFLEVLNESYHELFNFIPLTREEMTWIINENLSIGIPDLLSFLEDENGRLVGIAMSIPSLNRGVPYPARAPQEQECGHAAHGRAARVCAHGHPCHLPQAAARGFSAARLRVRLHFAAAGKQYRRPHLAEIRCGGDCETEVLC